MSTETLIDLFKQWVVPSYGRYPLAFVRGQGARVWDPEGKEYLDFGGGIAVNSLGHAHPELARAIARQAQTLIHTSNLYYTEPQGLLARRLVELVGAGKCFFCNSGGEANEALYKLARKFGHDSGRYEILTAMNSFHGRTLAGIAATGQEKVKKGFEPPVDGFRHVPFNDLAAMEQAISPKTAAILVEGVQGESGIRPASPEYLLGLRKLCNERKLLFLLDAVQDGMFRTGQFQSYQRILEGNPEAASFLPDAISMAKGLAGGFPIGAVWIRSPHADLLGPGTHASTFGGTPLACFTALTVLDIVNREKLADNARAMGDRLKAAVLKLKSPHVREVRGLGLMIGIELQPDISTLKQEGKTPASLLVERLHQEGLLTIPAGNTTIRLLPPLNITRAEADEAVSRLQNGLQKLS
jgi:acetylornithine aminotransferase/acetylornithine/N-succinyldiaminopimelate aminotransferase